MQTADGDNVRDARPKSPTECRALAVHEHAMSLIAQACVRELAKRDREVCVMNFSAAEQHEHAAGVLAGLWDQLDEQTRATDGWLAEAFGNAP